MWRRQENGQCMHPKRTAGTPPVSTGWEASGDRARPVVPDRTRMCSSAVPLAQHRKAAGQEAQVLKHGKENL